MSAAQWLSHPTLGLGARCDMFPPLPVAQCCPVQGKTRSVKFSHWMLGNSKSARHRPGYGLVSAMARSPESVKLLLSCDAVSNSAPARQLVGFWWHWYILGSPSAKLQYQITMPLLAGTVHSGWVRPGVRQCITSIGKAIEIPWVMICSKLPARQIIAHLALRSTAIWMLSRLLGSPHLAATPCKSICGVVLSCCQCIKTCISSPYLFSSHPLPLCTPTIIHLVLKCLSSLSTVFLTLPTSTFGDISDLSHYGYRQDGLCQWAA